MLQIQGCYGAENLSNVGGVLIQQQMNSLLHYTKKDDGGGGGVSSSNSGLKPLEKQSQAAAANKHALAERHRRKRINNHLNTLRKLFPNLPKSDKPRVLMETVRYLKELRKKVAEHVEMGNDDEIGGCCNIEKKGKLSLFLPSEKDEVTVSYCKGGDDQGKLTMVKAMICCEDRPRLNMDLTEAVKSAKGKVVKAEMCTIGGRTKAVLVVQWCKDGGGVEEQVGLLKKALKAVVENRALGCSSLLGPRMISSSWTSLGLERAGGCDSVSAARPITDALL
ncbi:hypothetical protein ACH5RR_026980 [Cinchona calisaya]|uniref:BHLH domain-containing protein n=1 Tax=Cinchona calisaya TaxID=153742 RepID=A0ABD2Z943_9GENT